MNATERQGPGGLLLIGYGNDLRRDDGAGRAFAAKLVEHLLRRGLSVNYLSVHQLTPELSVELAEARLSAALFVDTRAAVVEREAVEITAIVDDPALSNVGHACNPATLLLIAKELYGRRPPAWLLTVPGYDFGHGEGFSSSVQRILDDPLPLVERLLENLTF